jgi:3-mercaptopyruvate sulfurtransferase SseA
VHLDPHLMDSWVDRLQAGYPFDHPIVAYCEGPAAPRARKLAEQLTWLGFEEVYYLVDGWDMWQAHHMPVDTPRF